MSDYWETHSLYSPNIEKNSLALLYGTMFVKKQWLSSSPPLYSYIFLISFHLIAAVIRFLILHGGTLLGGLEQLPLTGDVIGSKPRDDALCNLLESICRQGQDGWSRT